MADFILEIGSEEIPARFLPGMEEDLKKAMQATLHEHCLDFADLKVFSTPRRAVAYVGGLSEVQRESEEVVQGPPAKVAFTAEGKPTPAAEGFARNHGVAMDDLFTITTDKGEYLAARKKTGGRSAMDILAEVCPAIITNMPFPKRMRWGSSPFLYVRPLHWVVALLNDEVVPFGVANIQSGRCSVGHRVHGEARIEIPAAADYFELMAQKGAVTVSAKDRREIIRREGEKSAEAVEGKVLWNEELLTEVQGLTEHPVPIIGNISPKYLELPREVLLTSMETHQKCFGIESRDDGELLPYFLTVLNIEPKTMSLVKQGWERVLTARLEDARFFWESDLAVPFDEWLASLDNVIFLAPLGSMGNKTRRLEKLCRYIARKIGYAEVEEAARAGRLSKADLVSGMVGEFSSLQGIMGGIYALKKGESRAVSSALREQYLPAGPDSPLPASLSGAILSMADKADTLVGCFGLGMIPTGAADPYALRRCALGIIRIILEYDLRLDLVELFAEAQDLYGDVHWKLSQDEALQKLLDFVTLRAKNYFVSTLACDVVLAEAVLAAGSDDIRSAKVRLAALIDFAARPNFAQAVLTFKRAANIIRKLDKDCADKVTGAFSKGYLQEPAEKELAAKLVEIGPRFDALWKENNFAELFVLLEELQPVVNAFFDQVMVMVDDEGLRFNRLNLLKNLVDRLGALADFNALQI